MNLSDRTFPGTAFLDLGTDSQLAHMAPARQSTMAVPFPPTAKEIEELGPSAIAFLKAVSEPHATSPLDATINGAFGGMIFSGTLGCAMTPFYSLAKRSHWPKTSVIPGRMAQVGFLLGGTAFLGTSILDRVGGKHTAFNTLLPGGVGGVASWRFASWAGLGMPVEKLGARVRVMPRLLPPAGLVLSTMSGAVMTSLAWSAMHETARAEDELTVVEHSEIWAPEVEPWAQSGGVRDAFAHAVAAAQSQRASV